MTAGRQENVKWVDGLRGVASLLVIFTHLSRAFDPDLYKPTDAEGSPARFIQYPIIRFFFQGRIGVPIFSLVTGYVCALKPIRLCAAGNQEAALKSITKSAFRRIPRLVLPASIATTGIWAICQLGGFEVAHHVSSWWLISTSPTRLYLGPAIKSLLFNLINTWVRSQNTYEANQWTLLPLLKGAFLVYMLLLATAYVQPRYRMIMSLGMFVYYYIANDPEYGTQFFFGTFLCDLSQYPPHIEWMAARQWSGRVLSPILILIGILLASYPETKAEWMPWSNFMLKLSYYIFPPEHPDTPRFFTGLGLEFLALGMHFSEPVKVAFSNKYLLWAGKNSFAVYLLHGTLLRTILVWMLYSLIPPAEILKEDGTYQQAPHLNMRGGFAFFFWLPVWFALQYWIANQWTKYVDPFCANMTQIMEKYVWEENGAERPVVALMPLTPMSVLPS